ncbi:uncharacterized protein LOC126984820 isoform X3 [Eriocheir sinensis]|uniref:uncharacterized protein LOC126984820 isoform X3 n=1 Tax=Eriocheir sinensis TaxID=95602 RepID=UPI0021CA7F5E|nr:uncharacterized protein LOC126984820 isoform X3 [Eriocheir sinensis]XP_050694961.1 uncharacterized protein LOC126984820 isoform X3 [Eriocheir sinensis]
MRPRGQVMSFPRWPATHLCAVLYIPSESRPNGHAQQVAPATGSNPAHRPRSSPRPGHRRRARITPFPTAAQSRHENSHCVGHGAEGSGGSLLPKWRRGTGHHNAATSLASGISALLPKPFAASSSPVIASSSTCTAKASQWSGKCSVPTISIDTHSSSSSSSLSSTSHPVKTASQNGECKDIISLENSKYVTERIHNLVSAFSQRANRVKEHITQPPTPSTDLSEGAEDGQNKIGEVRHTLDSIEGEEPATKGSDLLMVGLGGRQAWLRHHLHLLTSSLTFPRAFEPQSRLYITWLLVVTFAYIYNACVIPLRSVFSHYQTDDNLAWWLTTDCLADLIYITDIVVFKSRVMYLDNGFWISSASLTRRHYFKTARFRYDLVSLLPLDLLYFKFGPISIFRIPRLFKIQTFWEFFNRLDSVLSSPHAVRVIRTVLNMLFLIHLNTCAYYGFSKLEGIGSNKWVFQGVGNAYIRCFYFATKTATSIGKNPKPENKAEYVFMTCSWLMGVFVFALLIGQIRDIVATATRNQNEYRRVMDHTQAYLHRLNLPTTLQERVRLWFAYTWQSQKTLNEMKCLESLPKKMRTDIAISVHIQTLSKVQLFQDCDKALFRDLVLKLQPVLYLPGDYVCKKGEVGKEMYIVQSGQVLVMGGDKVLATLGEGSVFGEISLLALAGGNRRTANVRSRGFSSLFVLSKADLQATIKDYPEAQEILKKKAKKLIQQNEERERQEPTADENVIIKSREATPKLLHTVLQVVRPDSYTASVIRRSSRSSQSSLPLSCPWTSSQASPFTSASSSTSHDPNHRRSSRSSASGHRRSSLEVPAALAGHRDSTVAKVSLSESLQEEEEEEEFVIVETCKEPASPASSCRSHHTTITLHHSSHPSSPIPHPTASPCMSSSSHEDVFDSDSDTEKPLAGQGYSKGDSHGQGSCESESKGYRTPTPEHWWPGVSKFNESLASSQQTSKEDLIQLSPIKEKQTVQITTEDSNKIKQVSSDLLNTEQQHVGGQDTVSGGDRNSAVQTPASDLPNGSVTNSFSTANDIQKINDNVGGQSSHCSPAMTQQTVKRAQSSTMKSTSDKRKGSSTSSKESLQHDSSAKEDNPFTDPNEESKKNIKQTKISENLDQVNMSFQPQHAEESSCGTSTNESKHGQSKSAKQLNETPLSNTELLASAHQPTSISAGSTENLLIKFGLNHGNKERSFFSSSPAQESHTSASPVSYDLFLTELSKTMPNTFDQVPILSSPSLSLNSGGSLPWQQSSLLSPPPPSPSSTMVPHQISCSAIVHRECSSPETSPFDAQESKL